MEGGTLTEAQNSLPGQVERPTYPPYRWGAPFYGLTFPNSLFCVDAEKLP